jgi:hypothetical protein
VVLLDAVGNSKAGPDGLMLGIWAGRWPPSSPLLTVLSWPFVVGREGVWWDRSPATPCVLFSLFITRRFTQHRSHMARLVSAAEVTRRGRGSCSRAEPHLPLVPLSPTTKQALWVRCRGNCRVTNNENRTTSAPCLLPNGSGSERQHSKWPLRPPSICQLRPTGLYCFLRS